jgi:hypothetical protein
MIGLGMRLAEISFAARLGCFLRLTLLAGFALFRRTLLIAAISRAALISATASLLLRTRIAMFTLLATLTTCAIVDLAQRAAEILDLAFVGEFLAFGQFHQFQNFFHLIHGALQRLHDFHHFINRLMDRADLMLRLRIGDAFGQTLNAFQQRSRL